MILSTLLNVISHLAFLPMVIHNGRTGRWHSVIIDLMSVAAASPAYHLCYGGTWCLWPLRTMTRLDLFTSQSVVTDIFNSLVPWNSVLWEFLVLLAVWITQAVILLQTDGDTDMLQYVVVIVSVTPWLCYLVWYALRGARRRLGEGNAKQKVDGGDADTYNEASLLYLDWNTGGRPRMCPPYNYKKLWLGIAIGFMGIALFRIHSLRHTLYNIVHPAWHVCVAIGGYYILCSSLARGLAYVVRPETRREWLGSMGAPRGFFVPSGGYVEEGSTLATSEPLSLTEDEVDEYGEMQKYPLIESKFRQIYHKFHSQT